MSALLALFAAPCALAIDRVPQDFATIQDAIDRGTSGEIVVGPGSWAGAVVRRKVSLRGLGARIETGPSARGIRAGFVLGGPASGSSVTGFTFDCQTGAVDLAVLGSARRTGAVADSVRIAENTFLGCVQGVTNAGPPTSGCTSMEPVRGGAYWTVADNHFLGFGTQTSSGATGGGLGVVVYNAVGAEILDNVFEGSIDDRPRIATAGVALAGCQACTVAFNDFRVTGSRYWWSPLLNKGAAQDGAAPSRDLLIVGNDALDSDVLVHVLSFASDRVVLEDNAASAWVDHTACGDGELYLSE